MTSGLFALDVALPPDLGFAAAAGLKDSLLAALALPRPCRLDGSAVTTVSTAAIQVLLAAARHQAARGVAFRLAAPSTALSEAFADLGLADELARQGEADG